MNRQLRFAIIVVLAICLAIKVDGAKPKQKGFIAGTAGAFKSGSLEEIMIYSDLDRDGRIDIITKSANLKMGEQQLNLYVWNQKLKEYQLWGSMPVAYISLQTVLVSSFKLLQAFHLVLYFSPSDSKPFIKMIPFSCQNYVCQFADEFVIPEIKSGIDTVPPSLLGSMGDIVLLFHSNSIANVLRFQKNNDTISYEIAPLSSLISNGTSVTNITYSYNGDYDGDCLTDLIILKTDPSTNTSKLQFIRGSQTNQFTFIQQMAITESILHFTIQDISKKQNNIDFDGKNDLILLLNTSKLQIHYHKYGSDKNLCNGLSLSQIPYDFELSDSEARQIQRVQFGNPIYAKSLLLFGDFNNDGYDDLSVSFMDSTNTYPQATLLQNKGCIDDACGTYNPRLIEQSSTLNLRTFSIKPVLGSTQVSTKLSFVDILDDGHLDFIFHLQVSDSTGVKYTTLQAIYNNVDYDAFFMTITIFTSLDQSQLFQNTEYIGGVASFYVTLISGELAPKTGNQLAQTGNALQLPYIRQGLGRTNNYLQDLTITVPRNPYSQFKWSPIIPNSDIVIFPPSIDNPSEEWLLQVMIEPTQKMGFVLLLVIISLGILGVVILRLAKKEKEEDKQTQQSFYTLLR